MGPSAALPPAVVTPGSNGHRAGSGPPSEDSGRDGDKTGSLVTCRLPPLVTRGIRVLFHSFCVGLSPKAKCILIQSKK